jgi:hypothetical protein
LSDTTGDANAAGADKTINTVQMLLES